MDLGAVRLAASHVHSTSSGAATWVVGAAVVALLVAGVILWMLARPGGSDGTDPGRGGGGGGTGGGPPDPSPRAGPAWWPEFEREFAAYVATGGDRRAVPPRPPVKGDRWKARELGSAVRALRRLNRHQRP